MKICDFVWNVLLIFDNVLHDPCTSAEIIRQGYYPSNARRLYIVNPNQVSETPWRRRRIQEINDFYNNVLTKTKL